MARWKVVVVVMVVVFDGEWRWVNYWTSEVGGSRSVTTECGQSVDRVWTLVQLLSLTPDCSCALSAALGLACAACAWQLQVLMVPGHGTYRLSSSQLCCGTWHHLSRDVGRSRGPKVQNGST